MAGKVVTPSSSSGVPVVSSAVAGTSCSVPLSASGAFAPSLRFATITWLGPLSELVVL